MLCEFESRETLPIREIMWGDFYVCWACLTVRNASWSIQEEDSMLDLSGKELKELIRIALFLEFFETFCSFSWGSFLVSSRSGMVVLMYGSILGQHKWKESHALMIKYSPFKYLIFVYFWIKSTLTLSLHEFALICQLMFIVNWWEKDLQ